MDPKNLPAYMISQPALTGYVEPALGSGSLTFYGDVSDPIGEGVIRFTLSVVAPPQICRSDPLSLLRLEPRTEAQLSLLPQSTGGLRYLWPWHDTGWQPFAWDLLPPVGERIYPVIRLVLGRSVELKMKASIGVNRNAAKSLGSVLGPRSPYVAVFRPQDDSLIPQPGEPIDPSRLIGMPFMAGPGAEEPGAERLGLNPFVTVNVTPKPLGVDFRNILDAYRVTIFIPPDKEGQPAAYAYELITPSEPNDVRVVMLRIVHTDNVYIKATAHEKWENFIEVESVRVDSADDVPPQGSSLGFFNFKPFPLDVKRSPKHQELIFVFEMVISFIPYIGPLYNVAQLAYAACTGQDFWGRDMSGADFLVMGAASLLPFALRSSRNVAALRAELKGSALAHTLDEGLTNEIRRVVGDRQLLEAVGQIDAKSTAQLARMLTLVASGKVTPARFLDEFNKSIINAYIGMLERSSIEKLMTADFRTFKNPQLAAGFNRFAAKLGKKGAGRIGDPIDWALRQTGKSRFAKELERELGSRWRDTLRRSRNDARFKPLNSTELAHYDSLAGRVEEHKTLAKLNRGHGDNFEVDHILEQRFWRNDPRVESAFDEVGEGMSMLVPKTPAVASSMPGNTIAYVHSTKTKMLSDLIPNGLEAHFSVQQIWDAHAFVLKALNVDASVALGDRLLDSFKMLARARGEKLTLRLPSGQMFSPTGKWPVLVGSSS